MRGGGNLKGGGGVDRRKNTLEFRMVDREREEDPDIPLSGKTHMKAKKR